jgi:hypothetical protein
MIKSSVIILFILFLGSACTPQKRLNRLIRNHPELLSKDTLHVTDTTITQKITADTVWISGINDTLYLEKDKLSVQIIRINDTIKVNATVLPDTIIKTISVPYDKLIVKPEKGSWLLNKIIFLALLLLVVVIILKIKRCEKK